MDNSVLRALIVGLLLAAGAIGLFFVLYFLVFAGADTAIRLFASLCSPPFLLAIVVGCYYILTRDDDTQ